MLTERELTHESNKAMGWMVIWFFATIGGFLWSVYATFIAPPYEFIRWALPVFLFAGSGFVSVLFAFRYARFNALLNGDDDEPQPPAPDLGPPRRDPTVMMNYQQHNPREPLILRQSENVLTKCRWQFQPHEWKRLVDQLKVNTDNGGRWKWTKKALRKAKLFNAELTPDVNIDNSADYSKICREFARLDVIKGSMNNWRVTDTGMWALSRAAGLGVIPGRG